MPTERVAYRHAVADCLEATPRDAPSPKPASARVRSRVLACAPACARGVALAALVAGCGPGLRGGAHVRDPMLGELLPELQEHFAPDHHGYTQLRLAVDADDGHWDQDVILGDDLYAERRTRRDGAVYTLGEDSLGAWIQLGERGVVREAPGAWRREVRTRRALLGLRFSEPGPDEDAEFLADGELSWEFAYRADGARTLDMVVSHESGLPTALTVFDDFGRLQVCDGLHWALRGTREVPVHVHCYTRYDTTRRPTEWRYGVRDSTPLAAAQVPAWARPTERVAAVPPLAAPVVVPIDREDEVDLRVRANGHEIALMMDTGNWQTILSGATARALGVIPTGEPPLYQRPPWLQQGHAWVGVIDHLDVEGVDLRAFRVLVEEELEVPGLLGVDFLRPLVMDMNLPQGTVTLWPAAMWPAQPGASALAVRGSMHAVQVDGEVFGVGRGSITLDTGANLTMVVTAPAMQRNHARRGHDDAYLGAPRDDTTESPDYYSAIDGLRLGALDFPAMPALGRDRERDLIGGVGLIGMGIMRLVRVAFDVAHRQVHLWPGDGYLALRRAGLEFRDADDGVRVARVVPGWPASGMLREDDEVLAINGTRVEDAREARAQIANARLRAPAVLRVRTHGRARNVVLRLWSGTERLAH